MDTAPDTLVMALAAMPGAMGGTAFARNPESTSIEKQSFTGILKAQILSAGEAESVNAQGLSATANRDDKGVATSQFAQTDDVITDADGDIARQDALVDKPQSGNIMPLAGLNSPQQSLSKANTAAKPEATLVSKTAEPVSVDSPEAGGSVPGDEIVASTTRDPSLDRSRDSSRTPALDTARDPFPGSSRASAAETARAPVFDWSRETAVDKERPFPGALARLSGDAPALPNTALTETTEVPTNTGRLATEGSSSSLKAERFAEFMSSSVGTPGSENQTAMTVDQFSTFQTLQQPLALSNPKAVPVSIATTLLA